MLISANKLFFSFVFKWSALIKIEIYLLNQKKNAKNFRRNSERTLCVCIASKYLTKSVIRNVIRFSCDGGKFNQFFFLSSLFHFVVNDERKKEEKKNSDSLSLSRHFPCMCWFQLKLFSVRAFYFSTFIVVLFSITFCFAQSALVFVCTCLYAAIPRNVAFFPLVCLQHICCYCCCCCSLRSTSPIRLLLIIHDVKLWNAQVL